MPLREDGAEVCCAMTESIGEAEVVSGVLGCRAASQLCEEGAWIVCWLYREVCVVQQQCNCSEENQAGEPEALLGHLKM